MNEDLKISKQSKLSIFLAAFVGAIIGGLIVGGIFLWLVFLAQMKRWLRVVLSR